MNAHSSLNSRREFLQDVLSSAFKVQESGMSAQLRSVISEIHGLITSATTESDHVFYLITEHARKVGNATGIAIALLERDQLVYRAGSGSAAAYVGKHALAVLSTPVRGHSHNEIMRVENAHTDVRIQAAICRELGATALLILPIVHNDAVAGILQILFDEPHTFAEPELRSYRIIAAFVEEVVDRQFQRKERRAVMPEIATLPSSLEPTAQRAQPSGDKDQTATVPASASATDQIRSTWVSVVTEPFSRTFKRLSRLLLPRTTTFSRPLFDTVRRNLAPLLVIAALIVVNWFTNRPVSPLDRSLPAPSAQAAQVSPVAAERSAKRPPKSQIASATADNEISLPASRFRRILVSRNEIDYISEDVTIRQFGTNTSLRPKPRATEWVNIGDDVTVRYFETKTTGATEPVTEDTRRQLAH
jgi:hypothetical protein